jgi:hypothetical protein
MLRHDRRATAHRSALCDAARTDRTRAKRSGERTSAKKRVPHGRRRNARPRRSRRCSRDGEGKPESSLPRHFLACAALPRGNLIGIVRRRVSPIFAGESSMLPAESGFGAGNFRRRRGAAKDGGEEN